MGGGRDVGGGECGPLSSAWLWVAPLLIVPSAPRFCDCVCWCVCVQCVFRLISVTLSPGDEAGQITLSAQPTHSALNEECEQQSEKLYYCIFPSKLLCAAVASCTL